MVQVDCPRFTNHNIVIFSYCCTICLLLFLWLVYNLFFHQKTQQQYASHQKACLSVDFFLNFALLSKLCDDQWCSSYCQKWQCHSQTMLQFDFIGHTYQPPKRQWENGVKFLSSNTSIFKSSSPLSILALPWMYGTDKSPGAKTCSRSNLLSFLFCCLSWNWLSRSILLCLPPLAFLSIFLAVRWSFRNDCLHRGTFIVCHTSR